MTPEQQAQVRQAQEQRAQMQQQAQARQAQMQQAQTQQARQAQMQQAQARQAQMQQQAAQQRAQQYGNVLRQQQQPQRGAPSLDQWARQRSGGWYGAQAPSPENYLSSSDRSQLDYMGQMATQHGSYPVQKRLNQLQFKSPKARAIADDYMFAREQGARNAEQAYIDSRRNELGYVEDAYPSGQDRYWQAKGSPTFDEFKRNQMSIQNAGQMREQARANQARERARQAELHRQAVLSGNWLPEG